MDCTNCFNCVRLPVRQRRPGCATGTRTDQMSGLRRFTVMLLAVSLAAWGLLNAAAMVAPFFGFIEQAAVPERE